MLVETKPTCDKAFAGIACRQGMDAEGRVRDLIPAVFDGDGVAPSHVWHVGDRVGAVPVIPNVGLLGLPLRILKGKSMSPEKEASEVIPHVAEHVKVCTSQ